MNIYKGLEDYCIVNYLVLLVFFFLSCVLETTEPIWKVCSPRLWKPLRQRLDSAYMGSLRRRRGSRRWDEYSLFSDDPGCLRCFHDYDLQSYYSISEGGWLEPILTFIAYDRCYRSNSFVFQLFYCVPFIHPWKHHKQTRTIYKHLNALILLTQTLLHSDQMVLHFYNKNA